MAEKVVLLVEGKDDENVVKNLLRHHKIAQAHFIKDKQGIENLLETLDVEIDASDLERLGIIVDADEKIESRWAQIHNILKKSGYTTVPDSPNANGTIVKEPGRPVIGIWLMPDNALPGMLEHFAGFLIPQADNLWGRAKQSVDDIPDEDRRFRKQHAIKAQIHTWLAWQQEPGKPLGLAITFRYLDADAPHAKQFMDWINRFLAV